DITLVQVGSSQNLEVEDTAYIACLLEKGGGKGSIDLSWSVSVPAQSYLEIYGEEGAALLDFQGLSYKFKTWDNWKRIQNQKTVKDAFASQINHFVDAVNGRPPTIITNEDGLKSQLGIEDTYKL